MLPQLFFQCVVYHIAANEHNDIYIPTPSVSVEVCEKLPVPIVETIVSALILLAIMPCTHKEYI